MAQARYGKILLSTLLFLVVLLFGGQALAQVTGSDVVKEALKYEGNRTIMDSAKNVQYIYGNLGIQLPGTLDALSKQGTLVKKGEPLQQGDIVFFGTSSTKLTSAG